MKFFRYYSLLLMFMPLMLPASVFAASPVSPEILVFGDSLSAGYGIERGQEWPRLLHNKLRQKEKPYRVINMSVSGETTAGGLRRLKAALKATKPEILILALGANDGLRGLSIKAMKTNLQDMINLALTRDIKVLLVGIRLPSNYGHAFTELFHQQYVNLAKTNPVKFLPFLLEGIGEDIKMFQSDGLHPNATAQPHIEKNIWQAIEPLLTRHIE